MLLVSLFGAIVLGGVGTVTSVGWVIGQILLSSYWEVRFLFESIKNRPAFLKILALALPLVLAVAYMMVVSIGFASFLSGKWSDAAYRMLAQMTMQRQAVLEILLCLLLFVLLVVIHSLLHKRSFGAWLFSFGVESVAALSVLVLYAGLLLPRPALTIYDLCAIDPALVRWPIYGIYAMVFKSFILLVSLLVTWLLRERRPAAFREDILTRDTAFYQRQAAKWITQYFWAAGISLLLFGSAASALLAYLLHRDGGVRNVQEACSVGFLALLFAAPVFVGLGLCYRALRPKTAKGYRQLAALGDERLFVQFYREIITGQAQELRLHAYKIFLQSEHFLVTIQSLRRRIELRIARRTEATAQEYEEMGV